MTRSVTTLCLGLLALGAACDHPEVPSAPPPAPPIDAELRRTIAQWGVVPIGPMPAREPALVELGRALMFDKILSGNRDISCATCHQPERAAGDGLSLAIGTGGTGLGAERTLGPGREFVPRNAPSLLNAGLGLFYVFWDGRISGFGAGPFQTPAGFALPPDLPNILAAQAMFPVLNRREMRGEPGDRDVFGNANELAQFGDSQYAAIWRAVMQRLLAIPEYADLFRAAYPGTPASQLGFQHAARAIAAFQMQALVKTGSPFDRYLSRDDAALTPLEKRGALLFFGKARCSSCHNGPFLGGQSFANVGAPQLGPGTGAGAPLDFGHGDVIGNEFYRFTFRVAPLRNVELTAPYMHDGAYATLDAVVRHYNDVPRALRSYDVSQLAPALQPRYHGDDATINAVLETLDFRLRTPLHLTDDELGEVVEFLRSLTDPAARELGALVPARVPSGLPVQD
ncbi:MAG: cytochrome-c peroxidase [Gemmatimonadales bacterium]